MLKVLAVGAVLCCGVALAYPGYYYSGGPLSSGADQFYAGMSDIDWSKRSGYDNWISPAYGYSSMADGDWGWKKRSDVAPAEDVDDDQGEDEVEEEDSMSPAKKKYYSRNSYFKKYDPSSLQRYYLPYNYRPQRSSYSSYSAPVAQASRSYGSSSPSSASSSSSPSSPSYRSFSSPLKKGYQYHSMADMDWGWKKRKRSAPAAAEKRYIGSLRNVASLRPRSHSSSLH